MDKTVVKALRLIEALARSARPRGVAELAHELALGKSNVHRLLDTLVGRGYVRRLEAEGRYELTLRLWEFGQAVLERLDVRIVARAPMEWLVERTGESAHLCILDGPEAIYVDRVQGTRPLSATNRIGGRAPAHRIASGKALLAGLPPETLKEVLPRLQPSVNTAAQAALLKELAKIRKTGFALNVGAWRPEVSGAGAPIYGPNKEVIAAIGIAGPTSRLPQRKLSALASKDIVEAARRASAALGGH